MKPKIIVNLSFAFLILFVFIVSARDKQGQVDFQSNRQNQPGFGRVEDSIINWPNTFGVQNTGKVFVEVDGAGKVWRFSTPIDPPNQYLFAGDIWVGGIIGDDTLVSVGYGGWSYTQEFLPPFDSQYTLFPTVTNPEYIADNTLRAGLTDTVISIWPSPYLQIDPIDGIHRPLNLKVAHRSYIWKTQHLNDVVICDVVITNMGNEPINDCYFGSYFDCDISATDYYYGWNEDLSGSFKEHGIGYSIDNDGDLADTLAPYPVTKIFAHKFLENSFKATDTNFNWWLRQYVPDDDDIDFGPRQIGTNEKPFRDFGTGGTGLPAGDANKYYIMSFDEWDYDQISTYSIGSNDPIWMEPPADLAGDFADGYDTRFLMSIGKFQLQPDSSARILFALFTGDFVHTTGNSINYLPNFPETYLSLLYFGDVISNAAVADSLAQVLLDPTLPPLGLEVELRQDSTIQLQWDPWVYEDVVGYNLYLSEANLDTLPYPGVVPPWWMPDLSVSPLELPRTHRLLIDSLNHSSHYVAAIAHRLASNQGQLSSPIQFKLNPRNIAPDVPSRYVFSTDGGPVKLRWQSSNNENVLHYNIYKFPDSTSATKAYHAQYDKGYLAQLVTPKDSFDVGDIKYYYYAMEPYARADAGDSVYLDYDGVEGDVYLITAYDQYGFESEFTPHLIANEVDAMTRDVLLITNSAAVSSVNYTYDDSILSYYNRLLQGLDYEIYLYRDSTHPLKCPVQNAECVDWHDFMSFKTVIIDDRLSENMFTIPIDQVNEHFVRYIAYGGKLVMFTRFRNYGFSIPDGFQEYFRIRNKYINDNLGVDSILFGGEKFYYNHSTPPYVDSLFGFTSANSIDSAIPGLCIDLNRDPFRSRLRNFWTSPTPPAVATFKYFNKPEIIPIQTFNSAFPDISLQQDHVIGLKQLHPKSNTSTYVFGYHLWYMDSVDAHNLILSVLYEGEEVLISHSTIFPFTFHTFQSHSITQQSALITLGNIAFGHTVDEVNTSTLQVNGSISPTDVELISSHPGYFGNVLRMEIPLNDLLSSYGPIWGTLNTTFEVTGHLNSGEAIKATGEIALIGHLRGDINRDGLLNTLDLNLIVGYLFREQSLPDEFILATMDPNGTIDVLDLAYVINYIFRGN